MDIHRKFQLSSYLLGSLGTVGVAEFMKMFVSMPKDGKF
jgi:hypothetical protein